MQHAPSPGKAPNNDGLHMLDYTMLWVHSLASEVTATHDQDLARRLYPLVKLFIDHLKSFADPQTGLLDLPQQHWSSTAYIDLFGFDSRYGQSAALNALYADTLRQAAQIADLLGDIDQAADWREQALDVQAGLNALLYQPLDGRYLTSIYLGAPVPPTIHAQAWPLAYRLVPAGQETNVADVLLEMLPSQPGEAELGIYGMSWVLDGLAQAGYTSEALDVIRLYYGYLLDNGATTWWEGFNNSEARPDASYSHGWGGAPTWFLTTYVLGAQRIGPDTWRVAPSFEGVDFASGVLPLEDGQLDVRWERISCGEFRLRILAPGGSQGQVVLPRFSSDLTVMVNGAAVWENGYALVDRAAASGKHVSLDLEAGLYELVGRYSCRP
jgi:alpha-L-rhamnosidase